MKGYSLVGAVAAIATAIMMLASPAAVAAVPQPSDVQLRLDAALAKYPGGVQISPDSIAWSDGAIVLTVASDFTPQSIGSCATGSYCAFSGTNYSGSKITFSDCSGNSHALSALGNTPGSVANARTAGTVTAKNGSTTAFTLAPNTGKSVVTGTVASLTCS
ncbi:hypothetical protein ET475_10825 [Microbacterium protaetiae]|uniref:Uncharacterized protein n=1 Tax=Microbacterium protaetiae TaxID=2509458 RepID=A0A4V0YDE5_9MICO|nr:peptidase inhibitor family I36 protein [Microbacterium protaetiae]QAY60431.1 hypothetical protein ET475_10825 [Microbacterium protaetiae]